MITAESARRTLETIRADAVAVAGSDQGTDHDIAWLLAAVTVLTEILDAMIVAPLTALPNQPPREKANHHEEDHHHHDV